MTDLQRLTNAAPWDGDLQSCAMCADAAATWCVGGEGWCADCLARAAINAVAGELARADKAEAERDKLQGDYDAAEELNDKLEAALQRTEENRNAAMQDAQEESARADKAEALLAEALEALEDIAKPRYGLQAVLEDGGSDDDIAHYYQSVCTQYHSIARATLAKIKENGHE